MERHGSETACFPVKHTVQFFDFRIYTVQWISIQIYGGTCFWGVRTDEGGLQQPSASFNWFLDYQLPCTSTYGLYMVVPFQSGEYMASKYQNMSNMFLRVSVGKHRSSDAA